MKELNNMGLIEIPVTEIATNTFKDFKELNIVIT